MMMGGGGPLLALWTQHTFRRLWKKIAKLMRCSLRMDTRNCLTCNHGFPVSIRLERKDIRKAAFAHGPNMTF